MISLTGNLTRVRKMPHDKQINVMRPMLGWGINGFGTGEERITKKKRRY